MNIKKDNFSLPFPPDRQQVELMRAVVDSGAAIASPGTDRYEIMDVLCEGGFMSRVHCSEALGVSQFSVTLSGLEAM